MPPGNIQIKANTVAEPLRILEPEKIVQEHPHRVESQVVRPTEFTTDRLRIETIRLPHLQLVDGGAGDKVAPHQPGLRGVPLLRLFDRPSACCHPSSFSPARDQHHSTFPGFLLHCPKVKNALRFKYERFSG